MRRQTFQIVIVLGIRRQTFQIVIVQGMKRQTFQGVIVLAMRRQTFQIVIVQGVMRQTFHSHSARDEEADISDSHSARDEEADISDSHSARGLERAANTGRRSDQRRRKLHFLVKHTYIQGKGGLYRNPPQFEHIFVAVITPPHPFFCAVTFDTSLLFIVCALR